MVMSKLKTMWNIFRHSAVPIGPLFKFIWQCNKFDIPNTQSYEILPQTQVNKANLNWLN